MGQSFPLPPASLQLPPGPLPDPARVSFSKKLARATSKDGMTPGDRKKKQALAEERATNEERAITEGVNLERATKAAQAKVQAGAQEEARAGAQVKAERGVIQVPNHELMHPYT